MNPANLLPIALIVLILGAAVAYIIRAKRRGRACIGCPDCASCNRCKKH